MNIGRCKVSDRIWQNQSEFAPVIKALGRIIFISFDDAGFYLVTSESLLYTHEGIVGDKIPVYAVKCKEEWCNNVYELRIFAELEK